jgi:hypothetical protein
MIGPDSPEPTRLDAEPPRADRAAMFLRPLVICWLLAVSNGCTMPPAAPPTSPGLPVPTRRPVAMVEGARLDLGEIEAALLERAGAEIVRERALDRAVAREAARRGIELDPDAELRERTRLTETLSTDPDRAERLLEELRAGRGLGPIRFAALLRRTALLRALVADDVEVSEDVARGAWDAVHGPARVTRIIAVADLRDATQVRRRLIEGEDFGTVAAEVSLDASGPRGGRLAPVSRFDPSWPRAFREAIFELQPGRVSDPVPVDGRVLLIEVLETRPPSGVTFEADRDRATAVARLAAERLLMDRLARRLVPEGTIEPLSPALRWSMSGDQTIDG